MKVLWFTNTPCGATEILSGQTITGGGWLYALEEQLKHLPNIDLHIAFYHKSEHAYFEYDGVKYYPIYHKAYLNKVDMIFGQLKAILFPPDDDTDIKKVLEVVHLVKPDIIHIHGSEENFGLLAKYIDPKNIVLSIQGLLNPCLEKLYSGIPKSVFLDREPLFYKLLNIGVNSHERQFIHNAIREAEIFNHIGNYIGRTQWDRECSLSLNPNRKYYVVNEILRKEFLSHNWVCKNHSSQFIITTTVSSGLYKGVETIYKTAKVLKAARFIFKWNVIGISQNDYIAKIIESNFGCHYSDFNIELLGRKNASQIIDTLDYSNIFVQVSHIENSPNSLCEAMVIGMPIIATFAGGTSSMIQDGIEGVLVQDGDPYSLAGTIMRASQNYSEMITMAKRGRVRAQQRHNPQNVYRELIDVYETIIKTND